MKWLVLLLLLPIAAAIDDPAGDVSVEYLLTSDTTLPPQDLSSVAGDWFPYMDITQHGILDETESMVGFWFELAGDETPPTAAVQYDSVEVWQYFTYHDEPFAIQWDYYRIFDDAWGRVLDMSTEPPAAVAWLWNSEKVPSDGVSFIGYVEKQALRDSNHVPARAGDDIVFSGAEVVPGWGGGFGPGFIGINPVICLGPGDLPDPKAAFGQDCGMRVTDTADGGTFTLEIDPPRTSDVLVETDAPFRGSNGLATTYDFQVRAINFAEEEQTYLVDFSSREADWDLYAPSTITIPAGGTETFNVAIGVPFLHTHGYAGIATVTLLDKENPSNADGTDLYIFWEDPAQPGGHHDTLYFHSEDYWHYMNTSALPAGKFGFQDIEARSGGSSTIDMKDTTPQFNNNYAYWNFGLRPGLALGLDFDPSKTGTLELQMNFPEAISTLDVSAELVLDRYSAPSITLGEGSFSATPDADNALVTIDLTILPEADLLPYELFSNLELRIEAESTTAMPSIDRDFRNAAISEEFSFLQLPLIDYHDVVDQELLDSISTLSVTPTLDPWNFQNPGKTAAYAFEVTNSADRKETVKWSVEGQGGEWAHVTPGESEVGGNSNATVFVEALIPDGTPEGIYEFLLFGEAGSGTQVFTKFAVEVVTSEVLPDQASQYEDIKSDALASEKAPPMALGFIVLALAAVAMRRRE